MVGRYRIWVKGESRRSVEIGVGAPNIIDVWQSSGIMPGYEFVDMRITDEDIVVLALKFPLTLIIAEKCMNNDVRPLLEEATTAVIVAYWGEA